MKLSLPPYTRVAVIGLALSASVFTTLVAVAPAGAAPAADGSSLMAYKGVGVQPPVFDGSTPVSADPTAPSLQPTPSPVATPVTPPAPQPVASTPAPRPTRAPHPVTPVPPVTHLPTHKPIPIPSPTPRPTPTPTPSPAHPSGSSLARAIAAIPGYAGADPVDWVISSRFGHYGMTDWYHNTIYLSPGIPSSQLASVAKHEYGHILEARAYNGDIPAMIAGVSRIFGGGGRGNLNGTELAADCIAIVNGATWTNYTGCSNPTWRAAARELIAGREL